MRRVFGQTGDGDVFAALPQALQGMPGTEEDQPYQLGQLPVAPLPMLRMAQRLAAAQVQRQVLAAHDRIGLHQGQQFTGERGVLLDTLIEADPKAFFFTADAVTLVRQAGGGHDETPMATVRTHRCPAGNSAIPARGHTRDGAAGGDARKVKAPVQLTRGLRLGGQGKPCQRHAQRTAARGGSGPDGSPVTHCQRNARGGQDT